MSDAIQGAMASVVIAVLAITGVSYYALLWSFIGALASMAFTPKEHNASALLTLFASGFVGAAGGDAVAAWVVPNTKIAVIMAAVVCGAGAKPLLSACVRALQSKVDKVI